MHHTNDSSFVVVASCARFVLCRYHISKLQGQRAVDDRVPLHDHLHLDGRFHALAFRHVLTNFRAYRRAFGAKAWQPTANRQEFCPRERFQISVKQHATLHTRVAQQTKCTHGARDTGSTEGARGRRGAHFRGHLGTPEGALRGFWGTLGQMEPGQGGTEIPPKK